MKEKIISKYNLMVEKIKEKFANSENRVIIFIKESRTKKNIVFICNIALTSLIFLFALLTYTKTLFYNDFFSISGFSFASSEDIYELDFTGVPLLHVSYFITKYFFQAFIIILGAFFALFIYFVISKVKNFSGKTNVIIYFIISLIIIQVLLGAFYVNVYTELGEEVFVGSKFHLVFCIILLIIKCVLNGILDSEFMKKEIKESATSIAFSFAIFFFVITIFFTPVYIFPGTIVRINGGDLISGNYGVLEFSAVNTYKSLLSFLVVASIISFGVSAFFFIFFRRIYVFYKPYNNFLGICTIFIFALIGLSYFLMYIDANLYLHYFQITMNTYSYIPLGLFICFALGSVICKITLSNLMVVYQVDSLKGANNLSSNTIQSDGQDDILDPIPAFSEIDLTKKTFDKNYNAKLKNQLEDATLPKIVNHIITYARYSKDKLSYNQNEIKIFLAGLAASKLSILQGMSGTGKTSLPKIFMEAIDGICDLVAVESSWRDKNELLGYYNEFNKKYTPKSFTQYLYKATLNQDIPYFIVLDEMNLSRIEYYFADFLSLMESREDSRYIKLYDVQLFPRIDEREKYLSLENGHTIKIPKNIWFIGTANRDESTFEISDKVYDRAQTLNFDKRAIKIQSPTEINYPSKFVSYTTLRELFDKAKQEFTIDLEKNETIIKVEEILKPYKIGFGNRILKQMEDFIKAYVACSEASSEAEKDIFINEALDAILLSKVIRKLELKQIFDLDILIDEFHKLKLSKCVEFLNTFAELS